MIDVADRRGLARALLTKAQRAELDRLGDRAGTPVVYLKAAWADPVLYGGFGERSGCDIDLLIRRDRFSSFVAELRRAGYRRVTLPGLRFAIETSKAWAFVTDGPSIAVDVHRALADRPWFRQDEAACIRRAVSYDGVDGPVLSLCPEDQVVYAAVHHANSRFALDGRHLEDVRRLVERFPIDWSAVWRHATAGYVRVPLVLLAEALRATHSDVPIDSSWLRPVERARLRACEWFVSPAAGLQRRRRLRRSLEYTTLMPLLSGRPTAWPSYVAHFALQRSIDRVFTRS